MINRQIFFDIKKNDIFIQEIMSDIILTYRPLSSNFNLFDDMMRDIQLLHINICDICNEKQKD